MSIETLLIVLAVIVCPLAMWLMMRGDHGHDHQHGAADRDGDTSAEIRALTARIAELEARAAGERR